MDDILNTGDSFGEDAFLSREDLLKQNTQLLSELRRQKQENDLLAGMLAGDYENFPEQEDLVRPQFPISDEAIDLFEGLPETFSLDEAFEEAERVGLKTYEAAGMVRIYMNEEMVVQDTERERFIKTGRKPYF